MKSVREQARQYYESNRITFEKLSQMSMTLFGKEVSNDTLRQWSSQDGGWKKSEITHKDKLNFLAELIYNRIEESHEELSVRELTDLISAYRDLIIKAVPVNDIKATRPVMQDIMDAVRNELGKDFNDSE